MNHFSLVGGAAAVYKFSCPSINLQIIHLIPTPHRTYESAGRAIENYLLNCYLPFVFNLNSFHRWLSAHIVKPPHISPDEHFHFRCPIV